MDEVYEPDEYAAERTNTLATISLGAALVGLFPLAIVFGALGFVEVGGRPHETGTGLAIAGCVLGVIELVLLIVVPVVLTFVR